MKKNLFLAAVASVALASCVNDESNAIVDAPQPLRFDAPVIVTQTRADGDEDTYSPVAGEITGSYSSDERFVVYCRRSVGLFDGWNSATDYFAASGEVAKKDQSYWATEKDHTWVIGNHYLTFAAYSPAEISGTVSYSNTGLTITDFSPNSQSDDQYDLMYTDRVLNRTNANNGSTPVNLTFQHALSSIVFSAMKGTEASKTYKITGLDVKGKFINKGTFKQNITESPKTETTEYSETASPSWENTVRSSEVITYTPTVNEFTVGTGANLFTGGESALLLIPQELEGSDAEILLDFTVSEEGKSDVVYTDFSIPLSSFKIHNVNGSLSSITEWVRGKRYIYRIQFGGTPKIQFHPTVTQWGDGGTAIFTIGQDIAVQGNGGNAEP